MPTACETATRRPRQNRPPRPRFLSNASQSRVATALLMAACLAVMSPPAALAQAVIATAAATGSLSDRVWTSMTNGWGPVEKDRSNGEQAEGDGATLTLNGVTYPKGLGTQAPSDIRFALNRACTSFTAVVGIDAEKGTEGSVVFQVWTDGVKQYDSGVMKGAMPSANVSVNLTGVTEIALIVTDAGDGNWSDHADWADARLSCRGDTRVPTATDARPLPGADERVVAANRTGVSSGR
jgi:hypothetical protein